MTEPAPEKKAKRESKLPVEVKRKGEKDGN